MKKFYYSLLVALLSFAFFSSCSPMKITLSSEFAPEYTTNPPGKITIPTVETNFDLYHFFPIDDEKIGMIKAVENRHVLRWNQSMLDAAEEMLIINLATRSIDRLSEQELNHYTSQIDNYFARMERLTAQNITAQLFGGSTDSNVSGWIPIPNSDERLEMEIFMRYTSRRKVQEAVNRFSFSNNVFGIDSKIEMKGRPNQLDVIYQDYNWHRNAETFPRYSQVSPDGKYILYRSILFDLENSTYKRISNAYFRNGYLIISRAWDNFYLISFPTKDDQNLYIEKTPFVPGKI